MRYLATLKRPFIPVLGITKNNLRVIPYLEAYLPNPSVSVYDVTMTNFCHSSLRRSNQAQQFALHSLLKLLMPPALKNRVSSGGLKYIE